MKICFDTSVLVAAVVDQLPQHEKALECFSAGFDEGVEACCSAHALAECYATLTALPLPRRIQPIEAAELIKVNFSGSLKILNIPKSAYMDSIVRVSRLGLRSGVIYDALHLTCAEASHCATLYTYNLKDFRRLEPRNIKVISP
jgi:predicted nucleic acid-binding protein